MSILLYRRPNYVERAPGYLNNSDCQKYVDRTKCSARAPPESLSFDRILNNETLPPCTLGDLMDYMIYVTHDAEILQFYLWYRDYCKRFDLLRPSDRALSPVWKHDSSGSSDQREEGSEEQWDDIAYKVDKAADKAGFAKSPAIPMPSGDDTNWPLKPPPEDAHEEDFTKYVQGSISAQKHRFSSHTMASQANSRTGLKWQGFSIQPFRSEVTRIIGHYVAPNSPRELPLTHRTRAAVLHALQNTTHPSAFAPAVDMIEKTLRYQAQPNFVRWSICNGNKPRVFFVRTMGVLHTIFGFVIAILLILSRASRWWRIFAAPVWFIGISTLIAAYKGLCVILHSTHQRNIKPWQDPAGLYSTYTGPHTDDDDDQMSKPMTPRSPTTPKKPYGDAGATGHFSMTTMTEFDEKKMSLDTFGSANDSYLSAESWVQRYKRKNLVRKVFDKTVKVQDGTLSVMQDKIAMQAQIWALLWTVGLTVGFTAIPKGNFY